jgi:hypothetical protein
MLHNHCFGYNLIFIAKQINKKDILPGLQLNLFIILVTSWVRRLTLRSAISRSDVSDRLLPLLIRAWMRANSSENANGLVR